MKAVETAKQAARELLSDGAEHTSLELYDRLLKIDGIGATRMFNVLRELEADGELAVTRKDGRTTGYRLNPTPARGAVKTRVGELKPGDAINFEEHNGLVTSYVDNLNEYPSGCLVVVSVTSRREQTFSGRPGGGQRHYRVEFDNGRAIDVSSSSKFPVVARDVNPTTLDEDTGGEFRSASSLLSGIFRGESYPEAEARVRREEAARTSSRRILTWVPRTPRSSLGYLVHGFELVEADVTQADARARYESETTIITYDRDGLDRRDDNGVSLRDALNQTKRDDVIDRLGDGARSLSHRGEAREVEPIYSSRRGVGSVLVGDAPAARSDRAKSLEEKIANMPVRESVEQARNVLDLHAPGTQARSEGIKRWQRLSYLDALARELRERAELLELTPLVPIEEREPLEALERIVRENGGSSYGRKRVEAIARRMQETGRGLWHTLHELDGSDGRGCDCRACKDGRTAKMIERARARATWADRTGITTDDLVKRVELVRAYLEDGALESAYRIMREVVGAAR